MRDRFREDEARVRRLAAQGGRPPLVECFYCANGTNVRKDRIETHTRKQHPDKRTPSFAPLLPESQSAKAPDAGKRTSEERPGEHRPILDYAARQAPPPDEQPSYWEACKEMDFGDLRAYIDEHLHGRSKGRARIRDSHGMEAPDQPVRTKDRLLDLLGLLSRKVVEEIREGGHYTADLRFSTESPRLRALRLRQNKLREALLESQSGSAKRRKKSKGLRRQLLRLDAQIADVAAEEQRLHSQPVTAAQRRRQLLLRRVEIVERIGRDIDRAFGAVGSKLITGRLPWSLLPPGELSTDTLRYHYTKLQRRNPHIRYDPVRIEKAFSLGPNNCYVGRDEFDGYVVFTFAHTEKALLECPVFGNAIYVIGSDWRRLSRLSKRDLLANRAGGTKKIVHKGDWFARVKGELGLR